MSGYPTYSKKPLLKPEELKVGDVLLYSGVPGFLSGILSFLIKLKTWSRFSHIELYLGGGRSATAKLSHGVNWYNLDKKYVAVLRPIYDETRASLDMTDAIYFHRMCVDEKQKYDVVGLFRFFRIGKESTDKAFCSEHVTRLCRRILVTYTKGNGVNYWFRPFSEFIDADNVSPGMFYSSPCFQVYENEDSPVDSQPTNERSISELD